jgi:solute carrier family 50 protein (sugar transporter)
MAGHETAVIVAKVLTIITTIMLRISLMPDFNRWRKNRNTGDMSVLPCVLLYTNCYALLYYAYAIDDMLPLFATSVLGVVVGGVLAYFFYQWTDYKRATMRIFIGSLVVCVSVTIYGWLALTGQTGQSSDAVGTTMGFITIATTVVMYASPMATIVKVIRTKTASSMPFTMGIVVVVNSFCWGLYAALVSNPFILAPNIAGFTLGIVQLSLTFIYPRSAPKDPQVVGARDEPALSVVVLSPVQDREQDRKWSSADGRKSPSFIAMRSPSREETTSWREMRSSSRQQ